MAPKDLALIGALGHEPWPWAIAPITAQSSALALGEELTCAVAATARVESTAKATSRA